MAKETLVAQRIGIVFRAARDVGGMTLDEVHEESGITPSLISRIERGDTFPSLRTLVILARAMDVKMAKIGRVIDEVGT